ncbi:MAG: sigma-70 family RNA polymerase sigma factor [Planctomycetota bacterium]
MIRPAEQSDLEELIAEHGPSVLGVCRRTTGDTDTALEAFQDTFLAFTDRWDSLDQESDLGPWLRETARRCAMARRRRANRHRLTELPGDHAALAVDIPSTLQTLADRDSRRILREEFAQLDPRDQQLLYLAFVEELAHRDIAQRIGCPRGSLHSRLRAARSRLQIKLRKRGFAAGFMLLLFLFRQNRDAFATGTGASLYGGGGVKAATTLATESSSRLAAGRMRWVAVLTIMLVLGMASFAARFALQPARPLKQWNVSPSTVSTPIPATETWAVDEAMEAAFARGGPMRSGTTELQKCEAS